MVLGRTSYCGHEYYVRQFEEERYWRQNVPQVVKERDRTWQYTRNGNTLWFQPLDEIPTGRGVASPQRIYDFEVAMKAEGLL